MEQRPTTGLPRGMLPFLFASAAMFAVMYSTQAILPDLGRAFRVSPSHAGLTISVLIVAVALGSWLWGPLSDRIGRRRSLILASSLIVAPSVGCALAPSFPVLVVLRAVQGLCMPGLMTIGVAYVVETWGHRVGARATGYWVTCLVAGGLVGRIGVALLTAAVGWRAALGAVAVLPLVATFVMRRRLPPETGRERRSEGSRATALRALLRNRQLVGSTAAASLLFFGFVGVFTYVDYRLERPPFSFSPAASSLVFLLWLLGVLGPAAGRLAARIGWRALAFVGVALSACGTACSLAPSLPLLALGLAALAIGNFCATTATQLGMGTASDEDRGLASAVYYSVYYLVGGLGGYLPGLAWQAWSWDGVGGVALATFALSFAGIAVAGPARSFGIQAQPASASSRG